MEKTTIRIKRGQQFEHYRVLLFSIAYRMIGSASDAEDLVQETYLRYQASADDEILSPKAYLATIITRLALDYLKSARVNREEYIGDWLPEPILTAGDRGVPLANLEQQETLSLAFMRLLESLSPPERAVFILHEIFDYPYNEIAAMIETSPANCRQIFHRAKQALQDKQTRFAAEPERQRKLLLSFLSASQAGNLETLTGLLAQDAICWADSGGKVSAIRKPIHGQHAVARFWTGLSRQIQTSLTFTMADINGSPALLFWQAGSLIVVLGVTTSPAGIQEIYGLMNPEKLAFLEKQLAPHP